MFRNTLAAAAAAVFALGAGTATAAAQDTTAAGQGRETGQVSDTAMAQDTSGYNAYPSNAAADSSADTAGTDSAHARHPKLPQQGGPVDTSGYTEFKETMGKAADTLSTPNGKTTNYQNREEYGGDSTAAGDSAAGSKDTARDSSGADSTSKH